MYLDRVDIERFRGVRETNEGGLNLEQFLEAYDPKAYDNPSHTVDTIVFGTVEGKIRSVMMITRRNHPCIGLLALPGGFVDYKEDLKAAALRELEEETGIRGIDAVQLKTYGDPGRDPRTRIITTVFATVVERDRIVFAAGDDAADADWFDIEMTENNGSYSLTLKGNKSGVTATASIASDCTEIAGIRDHHFRMLKSDGIAADHAALLTESYLKMTGGI